MLKDFGIDFDLNHKELSNRFTQKSICRGNIAQVDFESFSQLLYEMFKNEGQKHYEFRDQVAL